MTRPFQGDLRAVSAGVLAYVGDAVYELHARLHALGNGASPSGALHRKTVRIVTASLQAEAARRLLPELTEAESAVYRRGRNNTTGSMPKHADPVAYRAATGLEAVIGFLYLTGDMERVETLMNRVCAIAEEREKRPPEPAEQGMEDACGGEESERPTGTGASVETEPGTDEDPEETGPETAGPSERKNHHE